MKKRDRSFGYLMTEQLFYACLPIEVVDAPSLGTSQARLAGALSSLVWLKMSLLTAGRG